MIPSLKDGEFTIQKYCLSVLNYEIAFFVTHKAKQKNFSSFKLNAFVQSSENFTGIEYRSYNQACLYYSMAAYKNIPLEQQGLLNKGKWGKPVLLSPNIEFFFNVSHSKRVFSVAFSKQCDIGLDIESLYRVVPNGLRNTAYTEQERLYIGSKGNHNHEFLRYWSAKEAVLKCAGYGLTESIKNIHLMPYRNGSMLAYFQSENLNNKQYYFLVPTPLIAGAFGFIAVPINAEQWLVNRVCNTQGYDYKWELE